MLLDLIRDAFLVNLILLDTAGVGQPRCIKDANLEKMLCVLTTFIRAITYYYSVFARKFVNVGRVSLALVVRTTSLVGVVKVIEFVVINVFAVKHIGDELQE